MIKGEGVYLIRGRFGASSDYKKPDHSDSTFCFWGCCGKANCKLTSEQNIDLLAIS